jgi:DNA-binding GntR family transcriptional regulator
MKPTDAERAYTQIKNKIVTIELQPGSVISEAGLMEELGLGRTPIREALKQLQAENLVIVTPRRGMYVADITITDLTQIYEIRVELESLCVRLAAQRASPAQLVQLKELVQKYKNADVMDKRFLIELDSEFHSLLAQSTQNKFLIKELEYFYNLALRIWYLAINYAMAQDIDVEAHIGILEAIEAGECEKASQRMRRHIETFHEKIRQYL